MAIPKEVQEKGKRADEIREQSYPANPETETENEDPGNTEKKPEPKAQDKPAPEASKEDSPEYLRQRLRVLQGKYESEVPRLHADNRKMQEQVTELESKLQNTQAEASPDYSEFFSEDEMEQFGEDTLKVVYRVSDQLARKHAGVASEKVESHVKRTQEQSDQERHGRLMGDLAARVPEWEQINEDPAFHEWLSQSTQIETDQGVASVQRQELLNRRHHSYNSQGVIKIFQDFQESRGGHAPDPLERKNLPSSAVTPDSTRPPGGEKRMFSRQEVKDFYAAKRRNEFKRDPEKGRALEREIDEAAAEGRIR